MKSLGPIAGLLALTVPLAAQAGNIAECEVVIMTEVEDEDGGSMQIASFRPAGDFLLGVYDEETEASLTLDGHPIRALMCERRNVIPDEDDYAILATGVQFSISQDFDSQDSDLLTVVFVDGAFRYKLSSTEPLDPDVEDRLKALLADFSARDHGLGETEAGETEAADAETMANDASEDVSYANEIALEETAEDE